MTSPSSVEPTSRFQPWWATVLAVIPLVVAASCVAVALRFAFLFISGAQYSILAVPAALVMLLLALFVGVPTIGYLRSRQRRLFVVSMVAAGLVAAGSVAFVLFVTG